MSGCLAVMKYAQGALLAGLLLVSAAVSQGRDTSADEQLRTLYEAEYRWRQQEFGQVPAEQGGWRDGPALPRVDAATQREPLAYWEGSLAALERRMA